MPSMERELNGWEKKLITMMILKQHNLNFQQFAFRCTVSAIMIIMASAIQMQMQRKFKPMYYMRVWVCVWNEMFTHVERHHLKCLCELCAKTLSLDSLNGFVKRTDPIRKLLLSCWCIAQSFWCSMRFIFSFYCIAVLTLNRTQIFQAKISVVCKI